VEAVDDGAIVVEGRNRRVSRRQHVVSGAVRRFFRGPKHQRAERTDASRTAASRRRPATADGPERFRVRRRQRRVRRTATPHARPGAQPRRSLRTPSGHSAVVPSDRARPARIPSRVHGRLAVVGRRRHRPSHAGAAGWGIVQARGRGAGKLPGSVQEPDVQARDGPDVVRGTVPAVRLHGQDGRRHSGELVQAARRAGSGRQQRPGRVRDRRQTDTGREQQVVREPSGIRG